MGEPGASLPLFDAVVSFAEAADVEDFEEAADFSDAEDFSLDAAFSDDFDFDFDFETVTMDEILSMVDCETPAFDRSATDSYGRPAMIFFAVASPTPGRASSSCWVAVLRSTFEDFFAAKPCAAVRKSSAATTARNRCARKFR
jgi:hypothetical protein